MITHRLIAFAIAALGLLVSPAFTRAAEPPARPNILWLTTEDIGPQVGCYGDRYADTPGIDAFASKSLLYLNAWSNAPVCAPARTAIITGVYPTATGSEHMRSTAPMPAFMKMSPQILREAGYYCTNNVKEDYNLASNGKVWDESSNKAHYKNRKAGQPFFAVFNHVGTHESQIRKRPHKAVHDPAKAPIPPYHPDTPEVRQDWAQYYDNITVMDKWFSEKLAELQASGLAEETIVFFYGDHGSGMPRGKRSPLNSGLRVPFIIHIPEKWKTLAPADYAPGGKTDRLVSFVDLAPTLFSLAGVKSPDWIDGKAFLGSLADPPREYLFGFRGRMDERADLARCMRDKRYVYVRNFMPHKLYGQQLAYMFETPTTSVWKQLFDEGKLTPVQAAFWQTKPPEELYDLTTDPWEVTNLAASPAHQQQLQKMRQALHDHLIETRDVDLLPEGEIHSRSKGSTPYEYGHSDAYPINRILETAELAAKRDAEAIPELIQRLSDKDSAVRYWAAMGLLIREKPTVDAHRDALLAAMTKDESVHVRIAAAEALARFGTADDLMPALKTLVAAADAKQHGIYATAAALQVIDELGDKAAGVKEEIAQIDIVDPTSYQRARDYPNRLMASIGERFGFDATQPAKRKKK